VAKKSPIPGSVFATRGKLAIKVRIPNKVDTDGKPVFETTYTGLMDTKDNRIIAERMKKDMYMRLHGLVASNGTASHVRMSEAFEEFLAAKSRMTSTERGYKTAYNRIVCVDYMIDADRLEKDVRAFVAMATREEWSPASINSYLRHIDTFARWLRDEHGLRIKPFSPRYGVKGYDPEVLTFTDEEITKILAWDGILPQRNQHWQWLCNEDDEFLWAETPYRHATELVAMITLMVETGARSVDVLTLTWSQVKASEIRWKNKITKRPEPRPISKAARMAIQSVREASEGPKVFPWTHGALSSLTKVFHGVLIRVGVDIDGRSLKHLRTTFKRRLTDKGLPFEVQMYLLRHATADVTLQNYTAIDDRKVLSLLEG